MPYCCEGCSGLFPDRLSAFQRVFTPNGHSQFLCRACTSNVHLTAQVAHFQRRLLDLANAGQPTESPYTQYRLSSEAGRGSAVYTVNRERAISEQHKRTIELLLGRIRLQEAELLLYRLRAQAALRYHNPRGHAGR